MRIFDYDWRLSNRYTARQLAERVETWLGEWRERTGDPTARVCFLCHSMGGLIVRYYLEVLGGRDIATRLLTLGTPFSGAVKAVRALTGDTFAKIPHVGDRITQLAQSFPSVGQLLRSPVRGTSRKRDRGTLGGKCPPRMCRPDADRQPATPRTGAA